MKKFIIGLTAAVVTTLSLATTADADQRWRRHHDNRSWDHEYREPHQRWRRHNEDRWNHQSWRRDRYRDNFGVVIVPRNDYNDYNDYAEYCFTKKVKRYDEWGDVYIKRVRVCR